MKRLGIYGGSFSPPHEGHRHLLSAFIAQEQLDEVMVIPACVPPHKLLHDDATPQQRLDMCRLAFNTMPVVVSDIEISRGGKSYTADTLERLSSCGAQLILLCGSDMFITLDTWYHPEKIFALAEIVYGFREDGAAEAVEMQKKATTCAQSFVERYGAVCRPLQMKTLPISSSILREWIAEGKSTEGFLVPAVRAYIQRWNLYQAH